METTLFCSICKAVAYTKDGKKIDRTCGHYNAQFVTREEKNELIGAFRQGQSDAVKDMFAQARIMVDIEYADMMREKEEKQKLEEMVRRMSDEEVVAAWTRLLRGYNPSEKHSPYVYMSTWAQMIDAEKKSRRL